MKIDGEDVSKSNGSNPIAIDGEVPLEVTIDNGTSKPVTVNAVRLIGRSVGATVFSSEIAIGAQLDPGETQTRTIQLDLRGITDQANGLFEGEVQLLDPDRGVIASHDAVWDVRGSMTSLFGLFAIMLLVVTIILTAFSFRDLATGRLSKNRWWRGVRFAFVGPLDRRHGPRVDVSAPARRTASGRRVSVASRARHRRLRARLAVA